MWCMRHHQKQPDSVSCHSWDLSQKSGFAVSYSLNISHLNTKNAGWENVVRELAALGWGVPS